MASGPFRGVALILFSKHAFPDGYLFYMAGKKFAELEAWKVQKESGAKWSLATINPTMIWGPSSTSASSYVSTLSC